MKLFHPGVDDDHTSSPSFAVANMPGGIGKTTISRIVDYIWSVADRPLRAVSIEERRSERMSKLIDGLDHFGLEPTPEAYVDAAGDHSTATLSHWSKIGERLAEGGQLLDFGANVVPRFAAWAEQSKPRALLEEAPPLNLLVPVTSQGNSAADGLLILQRFKAVEPFFMKLRLIAVFNDVHGSVAKAQEPSIVELRSHVERNAIPVLAIPRGSIDIANEHSFMELAMAEPRDFARAINETPMSANGKLMLFRTWLDEAVAAAEAVGLVPSASKASKASLREASKEATKGTSKAASLPAPTAPVG